MLFNTFEFPILLLLVLAGYFTFRSVAGQNRILLAASYVFYGWWDWRFCGLLLASTLTDYHIARWLERSAAPGRRRQLLGASLAVNLGLLGFFKYWDLFASTGNGFAHFLGAEGFVLPELHLLLPVGISFYTFQTLAYSIDVYRRTVPACDSLRDFALYVSFFPQLVAGPIERPARLLPAIQEPRRVTSATVEEAVFLFASGWFRKSLGDVLGSLADPGFADPASSAPYALLWGLYAFTFQVYLDWTGYTDMARGTAKLFGFDLMENFRAPYLTRNIADFWRRWHISLSSWLRDYLYIPLGGNRGGFARSQFNIFLTMVLCGLWHGAAWSFVFFGAFHGALLAIHRLMGRLGLTAPRDRPNTWRRWLGEVPCIVVTFHLFFVSLIAFRAQPTAELGSFEVMREYARGLLAVFRSEALPPPPALAWILAPIVLDLLIVSRGDSYWARRWPWPIRGALVALLVALGFFLGSGGSRAFIYFQF